MRKQYKIKSDEINTLVTKYMSVGNKVYNDILFKSENFMNEKDDVDETLLDISETFLKLARDKKKDKVFTDVYYTLSYMLRSLAHLIYRKYNRSKNRNNNRFLRLISNNKDISTINKWQ